MGSCELFSGAGFTLSPLDLSLPSSKDHKLEPLAPSSFVFNIKYTKRRVMERVNSNMIYMIHCKNLCKCKCHNVSPTSTTIKEKTKTKIHQKT
jgi:hypothetical protein